MAVAVGVWTQV